MSKKQKLGSQPKREQGVALITAMLMTALASILAVSLLSDQHLNFRRTGNVLDGDRAYVFAMGVESWVQHLLVRDDKAKDSLDEDWAVVLPPIIVEGGSVAGKLEDMQGRFNINNLITAEGERSEDDVNRFRNLLRAVGASEELVSPIVDWMDKDTEPTFEGGWGAEDDEYSGYEVPYRTANQPLRSPSELMLVKGMTVEIYGQLAPFITALPSRTKVNVNTASAEVLMSLSPDITRGNAENVIELREETPFDTVQAFTDLDDIPDNAVDVDAVSVTSSYFLMDATARYGERGKVHMYSLLARDGDKVHTVMRAQGVY